MASEQEEREKAFLELQDRAQTNVDLLRRVLQSERAATVTKQRMELVMAELKAVPDNAPIYQQIGRAYFLEPKAAVMKDGEETIKAATTEAEVCKKKMETLEKKLTETKKEMQELAKAG